MTFEKEISFMAIQAQLTLLIFQTMESYLQLAELTQML